MRIGLISDIHANLPALDAVLAHMDKRGIETKICLGDIVGYGGFPNECVERVVGTCKLIVQGNHDEACVDLDKALGFNPLAKAAIHWTAQHTSSSNKEFLENLQLGYETDDGLLFVHGSPARPFDYIFDMDDAKIVFSQEPNFKIAFVGHTHQPAVFRMEGGYQKPRWTNGEVASFTTSLEEDDRHIVSVGSVGQPRDNDTRACYAEYDTETREIKFHRVAYSIDRAIGRMQQANLPMQLWQRLMIGK